MPDKLLDFYKQLKSQNIEVGPDVETFKTALRDGTTAREFLKYLGTKNISAPSLNDVETWIGVKKKEGGTVPPKPTEVFRFDLSSRPETTTEKTNRHQVVKNLGAQEFLNRYNQSQTFDWTQGSGDIGRALGSKFEFLQTREGKVGKILNDYTTTGRSDMNDLMYVRDVAPTAAYEVMKQYVPTLQNPSAITDQDINLFQKNSQAAIQKEVMQNYLNFGKKVSDDAFGTLASFNYVDQTKLGMPNYMDQLSKQFNANRQKELDSLNSQIPKTVSGAGGGVAMAPLPNIRSDADQQEYIKRSSLINEKYDKAIDAAAKLSALSVLKGKPNATAFDVGMEYLKVADPVKYSIRKKVQTSDDDRMIAELGSQVKMASQDPNYIKAATEERDRLDVKYPSAIIADTYHRISAELYKSERNWVFNPAETSEDVDNIIGQLPQRNRDVYYKYIRPKLKTSGGTLESISKGVASAILPSFGARSISESLSDVATSKIPQSGAVNWFTKGFVNTAIETGKGIGNITGLRSDKDIALDILNKPYKTGEQQVGESPFASAKLNAYKQRITKGEKLTTDELDEYTDLKSYNDVRTGFDKWIDNSFNVLGQVAFQALASKGIGAGISKGASAISGLGAGFRTTAALGAEELAISSSLGKLSEQSLQTIQKVAAAGVGYMSSLNGAAEQAMQLMPDSPTKRAIFAHAVAFFNAASENVFQDQKVIDAIGKEVAPNIAKVIEKIGTEGMTRELFESSIKKAVLSGAKLIKYSGIETTKEAVEESLTSIGTSLTTALLSPSQFQFSEAAKDAVNTFTSMLVDGALVGTMAGVKEFRVNNIGIPYLSQLGVNPEFTNDVKSVMLKMKTDGKLSDQDYNDKLSLIDNIGKAHQSMQASPEVFQSLSRRAYDKYSVALAYENYLGDKVKQTNDEAVKGQLNKKIQESKNLRTAILGKELFVDENYVVVTPQQAIDNINQKTNQDATKESQGQVQEGSTESNIAEPARTQDGQPKEGQGEGGAGQGAVTTANVGDSNISSQAQVTSLLDKSVIATIISKDDGVTEEKIEGYVVDESDGKVVIQDPENNFHTVSIDKVKLVEEPVAETSVVSSKTQPTQEVAAPKITDQEIEQDIERDRLSEEVYRTKNEIARSENTEEAIVKYNEAKKALEDFDASIEKKKDVLRATGNVQTLIEDESIASQREGYEYKELYEQDPRLAALQNARDMVEFIQSGKLEKDYIEQGESEENAKANSEKSLKRNQRDIADLEADLQANPIASSKTQQQVEIEQYTPLTEDQISHEKKFTRDNSIDYEEDVRETESGREVTYLSRVTVEVIDNNTGDAIGGLTKIVDEDKNVSWQVQDLDGNELGKEDFDTMKEAKDALLKNWNKVQKKEFDKEVKKKAKAAERAAAKEAKKAQAQLDKKANQAKKAQPQQVEGETAAATNLTPVVTETTPVEPAMAQQPAQVTETERQLREEMKPELDRILDDAVAKLQQSYTGTGVNVSVVDNENDFVKEAGTQNARGLDGVFIASSGRIIIDKSKLKDAITAGRVVWHEGTHPIMNIIRNTNKPLYDRVVRGMKQASKTNAKVRAAVNWVEKNKAIYNTEGVKDDEALVESIAMIADGTLDLNTMPDSFKQSLIDFINSIAKSLGFKQVLSDTDMKAFKDLAAKVSLTLREGRGIADVVGRENIKEYMNKSVSPGIVAAGEIKLQGKVSDQIDIYQSKDVSNIPTRTLEDVYNSYGGKAVVINSDPTRVGELKLPSGKTIFMYGGPGYLAIGDNTKSNVGFATTQLSKVKTWDDYSRELFGGGKGVTLVGTQAPTSMLSNSYSLRYVLDAISMLPKQILRSSEFKSEFFGNDLALLRDAFGEEGYKAFISKYKNADLSNGLVIDGMISEMGYKLGADNRPASFKARSAFVSNLLAGIELRSKLKTVEGDEGYVSKKPNKFIAKQLLDRLGISTEKLLRDMGEPSLVNLYMDKGKWGMAVSGFEYDPSLKISDVQSGGVVHPLFNAKFPGTKAFALDGAYDLNEMFTPIEITSPKGAPYTKTAAQMLAGSMYVKGEQQQTDKSFEYKKAAPSAGKIEPPITPVAENAEPQIQASAGNRDIINGFYSPIESRISEFKQPRASVQKWKEIVGVKSDEAVFSGMSNWLNEKKPDQQLSKDDVLGFMKDNRIEIKESGFNRYGNILNRQKAIDEFLLGEPVAAIQPDGQSMPVEMETLDEFNDYDSFVAGGEDATRYSGYQLPNGINYKEVLITLPRKEVVPTYKSSHFSEPNIITHLRMNTRTDDNGSKVLFLEEIQSDWGQEGKKSGFKGDLNETEIKKINELENKKNEIKKALKSYTLLNDIVGDDFRNTNDPNFRPDPVYTLLDIIEGNISNVIDNPYYDPSDVERNNSRIIQNVNGSISYWGRYVTGIDFSPEQILSIVEAYKEDSNEGRNKEPRGFDGNRKTLFKLLEYRKINAEITQIVNNKKYGVSSAPYVTNTNSWVKLGLKVALKEAVRQGADKIAWTTGDQQNARYDLRKQADAITWQKEQDGTYAIEVMQYGQTIHDERFMTESMLEDAIGKDPASKILNSQDTSGTLEGDDLTVGGKGMKAFYGDAENAGIVGNVAKALVKELTGSKADIATSSIKAGTDSRYVNNTEGIKKYSKAGYTFTYNGQTITKMEAYELIERGEELLALNNQSSLQPAIEITPELKASVEGGMPQFSAGNRSEENFTKMTSDPNFKLGAFVMRKKLEGTDPDEIRQAVKSVMPQMSDADINKLVSDPEQFISDSFPSLSDDLKSNLINKARVQNIYRSSRYGSTNPAYSGMEVPMDRVRQYLEKNKIKDRWMADAFEKFRDKYFSPSRGLPDWILGVKELAAGKKNLEIKNAVALIESLKQEAARIGFNDWNAFSEAMKASVEVERVIPNTTELTMFDAGVAAAGRPYTTPDSNLPLAYPKKILAIPSELRPFAIKMRAQIDALSSDLIGNGYVTPEQAVNIEKNIGSYINRAYRLFNEKGYKPPKEVVENAHKYLADIEFNKLLSAYFPTSKSKEVGPARQEATNVDAATIDRLMQEAQDLAQKQIEVILTRDANPYFGKFDSRDIGILRRRENIAEPIRRLMGEYTDPGVTFLMTISKQAALKAQSEYLMNIRKMGMGTLFFERDDPKRPLEYSSQIGSSGGESLTPLGGLYTTRDIHEALMQVEPTYNNLTNAWMKIVGAVRWGKTVGSPVTQFKNFLSNIGFAVMNGHITTASLSRMAKAGGSLSKKQSSELANKVVSLNLVNQSVSAREISEMLGSGDIHQIAVDMALNPDTPWGKKMTRRTNLVNALNNLYTKADDFWKVYAYLNERSTLAKAKFDSEYDALSQDQQSQIDLEASERVKNTYPTYDRVWEGAKYISKRAPIFGNFVSFQAESLRVQANTIRYILDDMKDPAMKAAAMKRLAGVVSYYSIRAAATYFAAQLGGMAMSGILGAAMGDDDEERRKRAFKKAMPLFARTSDILVIKTEEPHKYIAYSLTSLEPYSLIPSSLNAFTEGRQGIFSREMEPGTIASVSEFFSKFMEPEMTYNTMSQILNNTNVKTNRPIVNSADQPADAFVKVVTFAWSQLQPSVVGLIERGMERGFLPEGAAAVGARPIDIDLHKSFGYQLSAMYKDMDQVSSEYIIIKRSDKYTEQEKADAEAKAEREKAFIISKMHETYADYISIGADPKALDEMINQKSSVKMTGFDKRTKNGIKTGQFNQESLFK